MIMADEHPHQFTVSDLTAATNEDMLGLSQFVGALRTHLAHIGEDPAAFGYPGPVKLTPETVAKEIRTRPELRYLYKQLNPRQQALAYNRYVLNTPETVKSFRLKSAVPTTKSVIDGSDVYGVGDVLTYSDISGMSPLEHDFHYTANPKRFINAKAWQQGLTRATSGLGIEGAENPFLDNFFGNSFIGTGANWISGKLVGRDFVQEDKEKLRRLRQGGSVAKHAPHLAAIPLSADERFRIQAAELAVPTGLDIIATMGLGAQAKAMHGSISAAAAGGSTAAKVAKPLTATTNFVVNNIAKPWANPFDGLITAAKHPIKSLKVAKNAVFHPLKTAWYGLTHPLDALTAANVAFDVSRSAKLATDLSTMKPGASITVNPDAATAYYLKSKYGDGEAPADKKKPRKKWDSVDTANTAGGAIIGGTLGALIARRNRLLGFLFGAGWGGAATAFYRGYLKSKS